MPPLYRAVALAPWRGMSALRVHQGLSPRESPPTSLRFMRAPIQRDRWHYFPRYTPAFDEMVSCDHAPLRIEERNVRLPDSTLAWRELQDGVVSLPPHPCGHAGSSA